jgi:hypothetical protein
MKALAFVPVLLFVVGALAQEKIPAGTILPVELNSSVRSNKVRTGESISGRIMQDVPLGQNEKIRAGSKVIGKIVRVRPVGPNAPAEVTVRFDTLVTQKRILPIETNLRAMATMMDIDDAQVPKTGPDRGTPEYYWTTEQIGGDTVYHGGGVVTHGSYIVGKSVANGVLVKVSAEGSEPCRSDVNDHRPQALWLFSADACGLYGFPDLKILHAGRTPPAGDIQLLSNKGDINIRAGSGLLLCVTDAK